MVLDATETKPTAAEQGGFSSDVSSEEGGFLSREGCFISPPRSLCTLDALERMRGALAGAGGVVLINCCPGRQQPRRQLRQRHQRPSQRQTKGDDAAGGRADGMDEGARVLELGGEPWPRFKASFTSAFACRGGEAHALRTSEGNVVLVGRAALDASEREELLLAHEPEAWLLACESLGLTRETL